SEEDHADYPVNGGDEDDEPSDNDDDDDDDDNDDEDEEAPCDHPWRHALLIPPLPSSPLPQPVP
ncbi:hypothetical protein Tco_0584833, partial [Tanacetum coccineum]